MQFFISLAVSSAVSSLAVERIFKRGFFKRRPVSVFGKQAYTHDTVPFQLVANKRRSPNAGTLLGHRLRRWHNIVPALGECVVFAEGPCLTFPPTRVVPLTTTGW